MTTPGGGGPAGCPTCGRPNRDGARFCAGCGDSLEPRCAACGAELEAGARFCDTCGAAVGGTSSAAASSGARKVVTVVFADLAGSTALAERMDPESVRAVMQRYYALIREVVEARHGRIVKFIGDGVMSVFGVPETREDDALNALQAALAMHEAFAPLAADVARDRDATIGLRVGVNTGEVVVGGDDDDVVGDAVNLAARLERAAPAGGVLVGESTWRLARGAALFESELVLHVAGKSEAVRAWQLVATERDTVELRTELVGRAREVDLLRSVFADAAATASPRLVTIVGSPGVGKTRLAFELERVVGGSSVLVARCTQQTGAPLGPIAAMLHAAVGGSAADPEATVERLGALFGDDGDRDRVLRAVGAVLGRGVGATPEESFWALRRLVEQRARTEPAVLVVDDLQWGEPMLVDLVEHLAEWTRGALLLVVTARPELREIRSALTDGARHTVIALEGLDSGATGELACELLGAASLPRELLERLPASTGGNPLFLRELLRMLVDDGVLRADAGGGWVLGVAPQAIDVPPTIQSLLAARLDRLSPDEQLVLERAAIWGTEFPLGALVELLPPTIAPRVQQVLEQLRRKELLEAVSSYWIDEPMHRFHHVLVRDAAYRRILRDVRASLHEQLAEWVDAKTAPRAGEHDELVGHHLEQSYRQRCELGPPDDHTSALGRTAAARLGAAAQRALDRDDPSAASLSGRALECLPPDDGTRADLLLIRCDALLTAADAIAAREAVAELERIAAPSPRLRAWSECFAAQLATIIDPSHLRETEQRAAEVAAELTELGDARGAAKAHAVHASALARLGRFAEVEDALDRALTRAREADDRRLATVALAAAPVAAVWGPSPVPRAGGRCLDVVRLLRITAGSPVVEATSLRCQAVLESFRGRTDAARRLLGTARESLLELGLVHGLLEAELFAGIVELGAGDVAAADDALRRAYDGLRDLGADADAARAGALLARVALERGALVDAERLAREAEQLAGDDLQAGISWRGVAAEVLARRGQHEEARALAEAAVAIAAQTDALVHHADACMSLAAVRQAAGDGAGAAQAAREAADLYERKGATALVAIANAALDRQADEPITAAPAAEHHEPGAAGHLANTCTGVYGHSAELFAQRDWSAMQDVVAPSFLYDDRRTMLSQYVEGYVSERNLSQVAELYGERFTARSLAIRGDRLALMGSHAEPTAAMAGQFTSDALLVVETNEQALLEAIVVFAADNLDAAVAELEHRYMTGDGEPFAEMLQLIAESTRAFNTRDWDALRATYAAAISQVDNSNGGWASSEGRNDMFALAADNATDLSDGYAVVQVIHACTADAAVATALVAGSVADGGAVERSTHLVYHRHGAAFDRLELFEEDDLERALAAYRRMVSPDVELSNRCTQVYGRWAELFAVRDWRGMTRVASESFVLDDRRQIVGRRAVGADALAVDQFYALEASATRAVLTPLAVRGDRLALIHTAYIAADGSEAFNEDGPCVFELGADDRLVAGVVFSAADLDAAVAELERRYIQGEGAPFAEMLQLVARGTRACNARDWEALQTVYAPEIITVNAGFAAGWGTSDDREALLGAMAEMFAVFEDARAMVREIVACSADAIVCATVVSAANADGGATEARHHIVYHRAGSMIDRMEVFDEAHIDDALAAFDAIDEPREPANRATDVLHRWAARFAAHELDAMRDLVVDDFVLDDRRPIVGALEHGRSAGLNMQLIAAHGAERLEIRVVAVRGSKLALVAAHGHSDEPGTELLAAETLSVVEIDDDNRLRSFTGFAPDDILGASAELDRRFVAGEGAPYAPVVRAIGGMHAAYNARDWDAVRAWCAPDVALVDHRPASWGALDLEGIVDTLEHLFVPDARMMLKQIYEATSDALLGSVVTSGHDADGALVESPQLVVVQQTTDGIARMETFAVEAFDDARARYRELTLEAPRSYAVENSCTASRHELCRAVEQRDWETVQLLHSAPLYKGEERRRGIHAMGASPLEGYQASADLGVVEMVYTSIAVRGERLALGEETYRGRGDGALEVRLLVVNEVGADGRFLYNASFDVDDLDSALAELEERYLDGDGADVASVWSRVVAGHRAMNARDWDTFAAGCTNDVVTIDHTYGGWTDRSGPGAYAAALASLIDPFPETRSFPVDILAISERAAAYVLGVVDRARPADVSPQIGVVRVAPAGFQRVETFPFDERAAALAAYERLTPEHQIANACTRAQDRLCELFSRRDWDALGTLFAPGFDGDDYRRGYVSFDADAIRSFGLIVELGGDDVELSFVPVAMRGDRLAVSEIWLLSSPFREPAYVLIEVDGDSRFVWMASYDGDCLEAAIADLDRRYVAGEAAPFREMVELVGDSMRAVNERDWDALRRLFAPDIVDVDHYAAGWGSRVGIEGAIAAIQELLAAFPNAHNSLQSVQAVAPYALVATTVVSSRDSDGAPAEMEFHVVYHRDARGRIDRMEVFPADALAEARARYAELATLSADVALPNRVLEVFREALEALVRGDEDAFADAHSPGLRCEDRRPLVGRVYGRDEFVGGLVRRPREFDLRLIADRGQELELHHARFRGTQADLDWEFEQLCVAELGRDGRIARTVIYGIDDLDTAYDELDRRYLEQLESAERGLDVVWHVASRWRDAFNARDWSAMRLVQASDLVFVDHTAAGYGGADRTHLETFGSAFVEATPDVRMRFEHVAAISDRGVLVAGRTTASNEAGGEFESTAWNVLGVRDGTIRSIDVFPRDRLDAARGRYNEVAP